MDDTVDYRGQGPPRHRPQGGMPCNEAREGRRVLIIKGDESPPRPVRHEAGVPEGPQDGNVRVEIGPVCGRRYEARARVVMLGRKSPGKVRRKVVAVGVHHPRSYGGRIGPVVMQVFRWGQRGSQARRVVGDGDRDLRGQEKGAAREGGRVHRRTERGLDAGVYLDVRSSVLRDSRDNRRQDAETRQYLLGHARAVRRAVAELTAAVVPPGPDIAASVDGHHEVRAGRDYRPGRPDSHLPGGACICRRAVAELAAPVASPCPKVAARVDGRREVRPGRHRDKDRAGRYLDGRTGARGSAVAELAAAVVPPGPDVAA